MEGLTDAYILSLKTVLIRDNKHIKRIIDSLGTMGAGNTNTSGYSPDEESAYTPEFLDGKPVSIFNPFKELGCSCDERVGIAAVVEDTVYLIVENSYSGERRVKAIGPGGCYGVRTEVAYDTFGIYRLTPEE